MSKLETAQKIGETSTKVFDQINEEDKKEGFNSLIDEVEENNTIKWLQDNWKLFSEEQKLKIYKRHSISIKTWLRYSNLPLFWLPEKIYNATKNAKTKGDNHTGKYALLEEIPCRFFVQLGILDKPQGLEDDQLKEDIRKDAKNINLYLGICQAACLAIPDVGPEISALVGVAKYYAKWYKQEGAEAVIERLNNKKEVKIKKDTGEKLLKALKPDKKSTTKKNSQKKAKTKKEEQLKKAA